jgi:hypothetical protein
MSFLSSHVAFAYRLADSQCHNNNEVKRHKSKSLFTFTCSTDEVIVTSATRNRRKSLPQNRYGSVTSKSGEKLIHGRDDDDGDRSAVTAEKRECQSHQAVPMQTLIHRKLGSGMDAANAMMTVKESVSSC